MECELARESDTFFLTTFPSMKTNEKRLRILSDDEIEALYGRPRFTEEDRERYFSLAPQEKPALEPFHSIKSRICFLLQLGYFKACHLFFSFDLRESREDVEHIRKKYFPDFHQEDLHVAKGTRLRQQRLILELFGYRICGEKERRQLEEKARQEAAICGKPVYVFRELMDFLEEQRVVAPGYTSLQDIVGGVLTFEQNRLATIVRRHFDPSERETLRNLLNDSEGLYEITRLKRDPRDFTYGEIKREIVRGEQIRGLYRLTCGLLPELAISNESVRYYASLVAYYSVYKLKRLKEELAHLYLLCFVYHRFQRFHDNLLNSLIYHVREFSDDAKKAARQRVYEHQTEAGQNLQKAGEVLRLFTDDDIGDTTPFREARELAFSILDREKLAAVADRITAEAVFDETTYEWEEIDRMGRQFKYHFRPVLQAVDFTAVSARGALMEAVAFLREVFRKGKSLNRYPSKVIPTKFIPDSAIRYLYAKDGCGGKRLIPYRYEFLVYRQLRDGLEAMDISCRDSIRFRSFEDDLVDRGLWEQNKERLIADTGLAILKMPIRKHLKELRERAESRLAEVNHRILSGENEYFKIHRQGGNTRWTLRDLPASEPVNHPVFETLGQSDITDVLRFVHRECGFLGTFDHVLGRYAKQNPDHDISSPA